MVLTLCVLGLGAALAWWHDDQGKQLVTRELRLRSLMGEMRRLDELLSMSALMATLTGDLGWEARHRQHLPLMVASAVEAMMIADPSTARVMLEAMADGEKLSSLDDRAFTLVAAGRRDDAAAVLDDPQYAETQARYTAAMHRVSRSVAERADAELADHGRRFHVSLGAATVVCAVLVFAWRGIIVRLLAQRGAAARQLAQDAANQDLEARVHMRTTELSETNARLEQSLEKLAATQRELMAASRKAGMAVVASGVLHNVGNVLNSVNVSSATAADILRRTRVDGLKMVSAILRGAEAEKIRRVPEYLDRLAEHLGEQHGRVLTELAALQRHIDHIKVVIAKQQTNARSLAVLELFDVAELVEDALRFESGSDARDGLQVRRELAEDLPIVLADRHKLTQILVNLVANARHAVRHHDGAEKVVLVRTRALPEERFAIEVEDTGYGIPPENLARIFEHGFTTKKDGHGFGLHASACHVQEMGGKLHAHSHGAGRGARFTIELPIAPPADRALARIVA